MVCKKNHRYNPIFDALGPSQAGEGRHKCVGCAYEAGFNDGFNGLPADFAKASEHLDDSQAGTGRHKDANEAYLIGYSNGTRSRHTS